jgi:glucose-6-phosphate isomerase
VIAESLGKKRLDGKRIGVTPLALQGPQDQHSVLQLLIDGPQDKVIWFFEAALSKPTKKRKLIAIFKEFEKRGLSESLSILCESTYRTFQERLENTETHQPISRFQWKSVQDFIHSIVLLQALTEYSAARLGINAIDQPGVERGKEIARALIQA